MEPQAPYGQPSLNSGGFDILFHVGPDGTYTVRGTSGAGPSLNPSASQSRTFNSLEDAMLYQVQLVEQAQGHSPVGEAFRPPY